MRSKLCWALAILAFGASTTVAHADQQKRKKVIDFAFREFDANKDNSLSEKEFVGEQRGEAKEIAKRKFRTLDRDSDQSVSHREFKDSQWSLWRNERR
jgi:hypothetical protein